MVAASRDGVRIKPGLFNALIWATGQGRNVSFQLREGESFRASSPEPVVLQCLVVLGRLTLASELLLTYCVTALLTH